MDEILQNMPYNSYQDLFNAILCGKATLKILRSDCSQIAAIKYPYFSYVGIYLGFLLSTVPVVTYCICFKNYWYLLLLPVLFLLNIIINLLPKLKILASILLFIELFIIKIHDTVFMLSSSIILLNVGYSFWWNKVYKYAIFELQDNQEAFIWSWNRCGITIEDCFGNKYNKLNSKIAKSGGNINVNNIT